MKRIVDARKVNQEEEEKKFKEKQDLNDLFEERNKKKLVKFIDKREREEPYRDRVVNFLKQNKFQKVAKKYKDELVTIYNFYTEIFDTNKEMPNYREFIQYRVILIKNLILFFKTLKKNINQNLNEINSLQKENKNFFKIF